MVLKESIKGQAHTQTSLLFMKKLTVANKGKSRQVYVLVDLPTESSSVPTLL